jgi:uncharacterized protein (TIGR01777 family)
MAGRVELATWTPEEPGAWQRRVDGADVVIHLAGAGVLDERWTPERMALIRSSRVRSTELLAEAIARAAARPRVFVRGSAIGYYGTKTGDAALEDGAAAGDDFLAKVVVDWERAAAPAREVGVRVVHPRIGVVLGLGGGVLDKLLPIFKAYVGGPVGDGKQWVAWVHRADVVSAIEHAIARDDLAGSFNVTAPEPVTMNDFARALGDALHRPAAVRVPAAAVRVALGEGAADVILTGPRAVPSRLAGSDFAFLFPDLRSALADLIAQPERVLL